MVQEPFNKYLAHYAEPEVRALDINWFRGRQYQHCIVIPAFDEASEFLTAVTRQVEFNSPALVICVVNAPDGNVDKSALQRTTVSYEHLVALGPCIGASADHGIRLIQSSAATGFDLLLVDRSSPDRQIPHQQGVGLARKLGNDLAVSLINLQVLHARWLHNTDADTLLPKRYLQNNMLDSASAYYWPFIHEPDARTAKAMYLYEFSLHYYVQGLAWAGSPYAFHTIGSTISINAHHYCNVRGVPKRNGAEDFHLLNKLAKVAPVLAADGEPIIIQGRDSTRVPFGTGPAIRNISAQAEPLEFHGFYNIRVFWALRHWLRSFPLLFSARREHPSWSASTILEHALTQHLPEWLAPNVFTSILLGLGAEKAITHAYAQGKTSAQFHRQLNTWFDALKTLQLIHALEGQGVSRQTFEQTRSNSIVRGALLQRGWVAQNLARLERKLMKEKSSKLNNEPP